MNAWDLGTISGIRIRIHWTFFLLPIYIYFSSLLAGSGIAAATVSILFVLAIFGCVLLHELGHALAARQFGIDTRDITLLPIGGVAALERMPRNPWQELWIAVAGPLVNVTIAATLFVGLSLTPLATAGLAGKFLTQLMFANIVLVVFNMIPAFPMDGGRVLRSVLAMFKDYSVATNIAATVGKIVAISFAFFALTSGNLMLLLVAAFVYFAAHSENVQVAREQYQSSNPRRNSFDSWVDHGTRSKSFKQRGGFHNDGEGDGIWYADASSSSENFSSQNTSSKNTVSVPATLAIHAVAAWLRNQSAAFCSVMDSGKVLGQISRTTVMNACAQGMGNLPIGRLL
jgi:Zn-dependent protease